MLHNLERIEGQTKAIFCTPTTTTAPLAIPVHNTTVQCAFTACDSLGAQVCTPYPVLSDTTLKLNKIISVFGKISRCLNQK
jgi:hypothetical protein